MPIGRTVASLRVARRRSQQELGDALGITKQAVSLLEHGPDRNWKPHLAATADFLCVSLDELTPHGDTRRAQKEIRRRFDAMLAERIGADPEGVMLAMRKSLMEKSDKIPLSTKRIMVAIMEAIASDILVEVGDSPGEAWKDPADSAKRIKLAGAKNGG